MALLTSSSAYTVDHPLPSRAKTKRGPLSGACRLDSIVESSPRTAANVSPIEKSVASRM